MEVGREMVPVLASSAANAKSTIWTALQLQQKSVPGGAGTSNVPALAAAPAKRTKREKSTVSSNGMTYADWLTKAIESTADRRLTLSEIYDWMVLNVPGLSGQRYLHSSKGWKNAVRHTLSVNSRFCKITRPGRPSYWAVSPTSSLSSSLDAIRVGNAEVGSRKRRSRTSSSSTPLLVEDSPSQKRAKPFPSSATTVHGSRNAISTTAVTPPASTPDSADMNPLVMSAHGNKSHDIGVAQYMIEYIPLALLAVAATATRAYSPKPTSNFRTSPTSAFVSFRPRQDAKG